MDRDLAAEIDELKKELTQVRKYILRGGLPKTSVADPQTGKEVLSPAGQAQLDDLRTQLIAYTDARNESGALAYAGTFRNIEGETERQSIWTSAVATDSLLQLNQDRQVEKVLGSVGNGQRLAILLALLKNPLTANQLVQVLGANTTGQVYHHLKPLVAADLVHEEKGVYAVIPYRIQGILMLLAGVQNLLDTRYTHGTWE